MGALDLGLNAYRGPGGSSGAPAIGTSNLAEVSTGTSLSRRPTSATVGNLYFRATANAASTNAIPEPASLLTLATGLLTLATGLLTLIAIPRRR